MISDVVEVRLSPAPERDPVYEPESEASSSKGRRGGCGRGTFDFGPDLAKYQAVKSVLHDKSAQTIKSHPCSFNLSKIAQHRYLTMIAFSRRACLRKGDPVKLRV